MGKLCSYFPEINNAIAKRHKKVGSLSLSPSLVLAFGSARRALADISHPHTLLHVTTTPSSLHRASCSTISHQLLDYDAARSKARKLSDKPANDPSKLPLVRCLPFHPPFATR